MATDIQTPAATNSPTQTETGETGLRKILMRSWQKSNGLTIMLWPLSLVYRLLFALRSQLYKMGVLASYTAPVPVIVVGNLSVGGTGKTPLVIYLIERLRELGFRPGVISRGYGGDASSYPLLLNANTPVEDSGDEPALIFRRTGAPIVVGPERAADVKLLLDRADVDVIVSDDGLQHLALNRDIEICLLDDTSPLKNLCCLPAGPLREPMSRLGSVDLIVRHQASGAVSEKAECPASNAGEFTMGLEPGEPHSLLESNQVSFDSSKPLHAIAGIGNPQRFFNTCREIGLTFTAHSFADHHRFEADDLNFNDGLAVLMTEKDAVKCQAFAKPQHWYLPVDAKLSSGFVEALLKKLKFEQ